MVVFLFKLAVLNALIFNVEIKSGTISILDNPIPRRRRRKINSSEQIFHFLTKKKNNNGNSKKFLTRLTRLRTLKKENNKKPR